MSIDDDGEISLKDIRLSVKLALLIIKNSLTNLNVTWMYNASGESYKRSINCFPLNFDTCL